MIDQCRKCGATVPINQRACAVCNTDAGFPNVRVANRPMEVAALATRYNGARASAVARGVEGKIDAFEAAVAVSKAVMNRSLGALSDWLNGTSPLFLSFHNQVRHLGRVPSENEWDQQREAAESTINPYYFQELNFAALTLDGRGLSYYGSYSVTLKSVTIEDRASVFEKNPFYFNRVHHVVSGQAPPVGYRSSWQARGRLAVAKLQAMITAGTSLAQFADVLMEARRNESDCDFVEVHIYGPINRLCIERIMGPEPTQGADRVIWRQVIRKAKEYRAVVEVTA